VVPTDNYCLIAIIVSRNYLPDTDFVPESTYKRDKMERDHL